jgi:hypothetical protein
MATAATKSSGSRKSAGTRRGRQDPLAIRLLKKDHREVERYFQDYEGLEDDAEKLALAQKICAALTVHAQIEEEIFYPEERGEVDDDLLDEALVEHASAKALIAEIQSMKPGDDLYDAKVKVLGEYIQHHVKEEEGEMFPEAQKTDLDLDAIGRRLESRKAELMEKLSAGQAN